MSNDPVIEGYCKSDLWTQTLGQVGTGNSSREVERLRVHYQEMRTNVGLLLSLTHVDQPDLTVHDLTHVDALWEIASMIFDCSNVNPAEAFVFGASALLHDAALSLSSYHNGFDSFSKTLEWQDAIALLSIKPDGSKMEISPEMRKQAIASVLRKRHAEQASFLVNSPWKTPQKGDLFLLDNPQLRNFYGSTIGQIAHSHWWPIQKVRDELSYPLGALAGVASFRVNKLKIAGMLRIADALHLDARRAPQFLRAIIGPSGDAAKHWSFQECMAVPHVEQRQVNFSCGKAFGVSESGAWWLLHDTLCAVDQELRSVNELFGDNGLLPLRADRVSGIDSPTSLSKRITTLGWQPIDTRIKISDVPKIIENLGGAKLYGDDVSVPLRELLLNASDAIQARRKLENRGASWGTAIVTLFKEGETYYLSVEDDGVGMSQSVMTGPLIDFGFSFWRSELAQEEFPGLSAKGMNATGRFGIGFFSVFMLGRNVSVTSRKVGNAVNSARKLEFFDGIASRPVLLHVQPEDVPVDGGTRVVVKLNKSPYSDEGLLHSGGKSFYKLRNVVANLVPAASFNIKVIEKNVAEDVVRANDWIRVDPEEILERCTLPSVSASSGYTSYALSHLMPLRSINGEVVGRAAIVPKGIHRGGVVVVDGFRAMKANNIIGILSGANQTALRNSAYPIISPTQLAEWATNQADAIRTLKYSDEHKAACAAVVLECGGKIFDLPVIRRGEDEWLNSVEFAEAIASEEEIKIVGISDLDWDMDNDTDVAKTDFETDFELNDSIFVSPDVGSYLMSFPGKVWPAREPSSESGWDRAIHRMVCDVWGSDFSCDSEDYTIGEAAHVDIERTVTVFGRDIEEGEDSE